MADRQAIVLDFGSHLLKVGSTLDWVPSHTLLTPQLPNSTAFSSPLECASGSASSCLLKKPVFSDDEKTFSWIQEVLRTICIKHIQSSLKDRRIVLCEEHLSNRNFKKVLCKVLFEHYTVASICFVPSMIIPLYTTGINTGIVVDIGYSGIRVMATERGVPSIHSFTFSDIGAGLIIGKIRQQLKIDGQAIAGKLLVSSVVAEDILVRCCYVKYKIDGIQNFYSDKNFTCNIEGFPILVPSKLRWEVCECLFEDFEESDSNNQSLQQCIVDCLLRTNVDTRMAAVENILITGGLGMLRGLTTRLALELKSLMVQLPELRKLLPRVKFAVPAFAPINRQWVGATIYGQLEGITEYTHEEYNSGCRIPDWTTQNDDILFKDPVSLINSKTRPAEVGITGSAITGEL